MDSLALPHAVSHEARHEVTVVTHVTCARGITMINAGVAANKEMLLLKQMIQILLPALEILSIFYLFFEQ